MSALNLKRNTVYRVIGDGYTDFPVGTLVKRCRWALAYDGSRKTEFADDRHSVVMRRVDNKTREYLYWDYFSADDVEEVV